MATEEMRDAQRRLWSAGDYPAVARQLLPISEEVVAGLPISAGTSLLDVAVGDGNAAIEAARRGATVTGIDITPAQIEKAKARIAAAGLQVRLQTADAEDLPFNDATFDVVVSIMGVIFAPDHVRASAELGRVVKPGGTVAITSWATDGWGVVWRQEAARLLPPPPAGAPDADAWGDPEEAVRRLRDAGLDAVAETRPFAFRFPSTDDAFSFLTRTVPPLVAMLEGLAAAGKRAEAEDAVRRAIDQSNVATGDADGCVLDAPYVLVTGIRPH